MDNNRAFTDLVEITYFNSENTKFYLTPAGFPALEAYMKKVVTNDHKEESEEVLWQDLGRVYFHRAFPFDMPTKFISVVDKEGKEYGIIKDVEDLSDEAKEIVLASLDRKYFAPEITKINSVKDRFGYSYWSVETDHGKMDFTLQDTFRAIARISDNRVVITDIKGNRFNITDVEALDHSSYRKIELYL